MKTLRDLPISLSIPPGQRGLVAGGVAVLGLIVLVGVFALSAGTAPPEPSAQQNENALPKSHKATTVRKVKTLTFKPDGTLVDD